MKRYIWPFLLIITYLSSSIDGRSQSDHLIIGDTSNTVVVVSLHNYTLGTVFEHTFFNLDMDGNGVADFTFQSFYEYYDSHGSAYLTLWSADSAFFVVDTVISDSGYYVYSLCQHFNAPLPVVRIYNGSDTLYSAACNYSAPMWITHWSFNSDGDYQCIYENLINWITGSPHYIGIRKKFGNKTYLGWIHVNVLDDWHIQLIEYALQPYLYIPSDTLFLKHSAESTDSIYIVSNTHWYIDSSFLPSWLSCNQASGTGNDTVTFTAKSSNPDTSTRSARIAVIMPLMHDTVNVTIIQKGGAFSIDILSFAPIILKPNPSSDKITIETYFEPPEGQLSILNLIGQELMRQTITNKSTTIDINNLPHGTYIVKLQSQKSVQVGKMIKE
jgi:hypothetical protein